MSLSDFKAAHRKEYIRYLSSFAWYAKRNAALKAAGYRCQECRRKKSKQVKLEVHHLTYQNFTREEPEDLQVLCKRCHKIADQERVVRVQEQNEEKLYDAQVNGWATKVYGEEWYERCDVNEVYEEFGEWLENKRYYGD
jgi:5-methylcytosine-specific restriction endonuclease McrA